MGGSLGGGGACGALIIGVACGALVIGGVGEAPTESEAHGGNGHCAADKDGAWGAGDMVSLSYCKTYHTRHSVLTNRSLIVSLIP